MTDDVIARLEALAHHNPDGLLVLNINKEPISDEEQILIPDQDTPQLFTDKIHIPSTNNNLHQIHGNLPNPTKQVLKYDIPQTNIMDSPVVGVISTDKSDTMPTHHISNSLNLPTELTTHMNTIRKPHPKTEPLTNIHCLKFCQLLQN